MESGVSSAEIVDPVHGSHRLAPNALGLRQVLFCIVTGAAPIAAMQFNVPWAVGGAGYAGPATFVLATIVLTIFSVGYIEMARRVTAAGGFYSFISHAFGAVVGMGAAVTIALSYTIFAAANVGVTAYFTQSNIANWTNGSVDLPIGLIYVVLIALAFGFSYFHIELTARILGICLVAEVLCLLIFDFVTLVRGGSHGIPAEALNPFDIMNNSDAKLGLGALAGIAFFGAFWSWVGFEMAPNYAEESRDPKRLMASATYISVIGLGLIYTLTCWMFVAGWGVGHSSEAIARQFGAPGFEPLPHGYASAFYPLTDQFVGHGLTIFFQLLMITGSFACLCAFFNTANRYWFSMGREGILPNALGRTHPTYRSPYIASMFTALIIAVWVLGFYLYDSTTLGALLKLGTYGPVLFVYGILGVQALCSFGVIWYFWSKARDGWHWWKTGLAPFIGGAAQIPVMYLVVHNSGKLGGSVWMMRNIFWIMLAIFLFGVALALVYRSVDRPRYEAIGRYLYEDA
jgi:amino acid transporter